MIEDREIDLLEMRRGPGDGKRRMEGERKTRCTMYTYQLPMMWVYLLSITYI